MHNKKINKKQSSIQLYTRGLGDLFEVREIENIEFSPNPCEVLLIKWLGEDISKLIMRLHTYELNVLLGNMVMNEVMLDVNMLCMSIIAFI